VVPRPAPAPTTPAILVPPRPDPSAPPDPSRGRISLGGFVRQLHEFLNGLRARFDQQARDSLAAEAPPGYVFKHVEFEGKWVPLSDVKLSDAQWAEILEEIDLDIDLADSDREPEERLSAAIRKASDPMVLLHFEGICEGYEGTEYDLEGGLPLHLHEFPCQVVLQVGWKVDEY
jgi:hypothetical protein